MPDQPTAADYSHREQWDLPAWPEMYDKLRQLQITIFVAEPGLELNLMAFTVASQAAGCRHCQAHGAYGLDGLGVPLAKIQALWSYETSELFDDRERAALRFALAAGGAPSNVTAAHHDDLRASFDDAEVRTLLGVVGISGFMNRYNDALATVTDAASAEWAATHLSPLGWDLGKHVGAQHEQRDAPPFGAH